MDNTECSLSITALDGGEQTVSVNCALWY